MEYDFGAVLARDQTLRHEFTLTNHSNQPVALGSVEVKVPCCSSVGTLPPSIPPNGVARLPVLLKAGHVADQKRVAFAIKTDSAAPPIRTLYVTAKFEPEWLVEAVGEAGPVLKIGQAGHREFRVVCRRKGGEGLRAPSAVEATGLVLAQPPGLAVEVEESTGVIESSRQVAVTLPTQSRAGEYVGTLLFRWPDGATRSHEVRWTVTPCLRVTPEALFYKPDQGSTPLTLVIAADDRPFRVLRASGPAIVGDVSLADRTATRQTVKLTIDPSRVPAGAKSELTILTDHPDQPTLIVGILILPTEKASQE